MDNILHGKGCFTWLLNRCEGGDIGELIKRAQEAQMTFLMPKIADGIAETKDNAPYLKNLIEMAHAAGIKVIAWQFVYLINPSSEAARAIVELKKYPYDGFVINAEGACKNKAAQAELYCETLRSAFPKMFMGLSSFRYPTYHPEFPFNTFLKYVDVNMPQVYWEDSDGTAGKQLQRSVNEFSDGHFIQRPILPTGAAYTNGKGWVAKAADVKAFIEAAEAMDLEAISFWEWYYPRERFPELWDAIVETPFAGVVVPDPIEPEPEPEPEPGTFWAICTAANALKVRSEPIYYEDDRNVVGYLVHDERRLVTAVQGIWWQVGPGEWVSSNFMARISEPAPEPEDPEGPGEPEVLTLGARVERLEEMHEDPSRHPPVGGGSG